MKLSGFDSIRKVNKNADGLIGTHKLSTTTNKGEKQVINKGKNTNVRSEAYYTNTSMVKVDRDESRLISIIKRILETE